MSGVLEVLGYPWFPLASHVSLTFTYGFLAKYGQVGRVVKVSDVFQQRAC